MPFSLRFSQLAASTAFLGGLAAAACASSPGSAPGADVGQREAGAESCAEPRPQVCTMIYAPVCAEHRDGRFETHASACNACADETVLAYAEGVCEEGRAP
jgi:hypothetical protein